MQQKASQKLKKQITQGLETNMDRLGKLEERVKQLLTEKSQAIALNKVFKLKALNTEIAQLTNSLNNIKSQQK